MSSFLQGPARRVRLLLSTSNRPAQVASIDGLAALVASLLLQSVAAIVDTADKSSKVAYVSPPPWLTVGVAVAAGCLAANFARLGSSLFRQHPYLRRSARLTVWSAVVCLLVVPAVCWLALQVLLDGSYRLGGLLFMVSVIGIGGVSIGLRIVGLLWPNGVLLPLRWSWYGKLVDARLSRRKWYQDLVANATADVLLAEAYASIQQDPLGG